VEQVAAHLRSQGEPKYVAGITETLADSELSDDVAATEGPDDLYQRAVAIVMGDQKASTSYLQRRLAVGYNRAADLIERMEREGLISPANAVGKRQILVDLPRPGSERVERRAARRG
jgi:S-DNA-T family DNA segregation ATPase FtsK/SpoIIIE